MNTELKNIAAAVAHVLKNYLQVVRGNLELLRRRREFAAEIVEMALGATRHSAALADRLLALGRLEPEAVRDFDLNHFVQQLTDSMAPTFGDGIRVELDLAADLASAFADPRAVQLVLLEVVANARAAMPNGGRPLVPAAPRPPRRPLRA